MIEIKGTLYLVDAGYWELEVPFTDSEYGCEYSNYRLAQVIRAHSRGDARSQMLCWMREFTAFGDIEWTESMSIRKLPNKQISILSLRRNVPWLLDSIIEKNRWYRQKSCNT